MGQEDSDQLTTSEAAAYVGVSPDTLRRWANAKQIRHVRLPSGQLRFQRGDLDGFLKPVEASA